jgi:hypothetical protein
MDGVPDKEIMELGTLLQKAVANCNSIHHYAADALGVDDMHELENHQVCVGFRNRVIQIEDAMLDRVQDGDVTNLTTAKMAVGIDRMRDMCSDCIRS